ncbi:MAG: SPOR domain-containing protein [Bradyrhizobium sp.]|nr:SPOR domain-containing protein [Bradyrhizobium sp.]
MANRYQDRAYSEEHLDSQYGSDQGESDPLAELARLVGETDPFGPTERGTAPRSAALREAYEPPPEPEAEHAAMGPPPWIQRANLRRDALKEAPKEIDRESQKEVGGGDYLGSMHRARRYAQPQQDYYQDGPAPHPENFAEAGPALDPSRYDDASYGQIDAALQDHQHEPADADDPYSYRSDYDEEPEDQGHKSRGGLVTVVAVLALAVVGTGAAWAYRTYFTSAHSGEPPIIKADNSPTKIIPVSSDSNAKVGDRIAPGDGAEKMVSREEPPVDVNAQSGAPQAAFPPLKDNDNPPSPASTSPPSTPPAAGPVPSPNNGTLPNGEPRKIKTFAVHGDEPDASASPANPPTAPAAPAKAARKSNAGATMPLSLTPQSQSAAASEPRAAATTPTQTASSGGYLVQVSSQRNEADAQASFKALQNKFPSVLGSQTPVIKRADLGEKGVYYRAMVGPFGTSDEASQLCGNLKSAGGQCVVQKN